MSELKKKYKQLSSISEKLFPRIKKIFITSRFDKWVTDKWNVIFTTNDDMIYGFGDDMMGSYESQVFKVTDPTVIDELCGKDLKKVVFGDRFMVVLTESHELYTGGYCLYGRCGNGIDSDTYCVLKKISIGGHLVVEICCGLTHTVILTDRQQVYTFGSYDDGDNSILTPTRISLGFEKITSISSGLWHAVALSKTGKAFSWGLHCSGQLGLNHNKENKPKLIEMPNNVSVKQISCGNYNSLLLTTEGNIYSFVHNISGSSAVNNKSLINEFNRPRLISSNSKFTEILANNWQSFAKNDSNGIEFWGQNIRGEDVFPPQQTECSSLQEAVIQYTNCPFTIEAILLTEDQLGTAIEANKCIESNRVMRTMVKDFNNPTNSDFSFKIKRQECDEPNESCPSDDPNNGYEFIYCQKWVIEENCDYLKKMFIYVKSIRESDEMEIKRFSYETYYQFIQYLYTDSIETKDIKLLNELLLLSDIYTEEELKTRCVSVIKPLLSVENVCNIYSSAITNNSVDLEEYCFDFMTQNMKKIVKTNDYSQMDSRFAKSFLTKYFAEQN